MQDAPLEPANEHMSHTAWGGGISVKLEKNGTELTEDICEKGTNPRSPST